LARDSISRSTIIATIRSQHRRDARSWAVLRISRSSAILRIVPSAAATWPCGKARSICMTVGSVPITVPPLSSALAFDHRGWQLAQVGQGSLLGPPLLVAEALP
jgi:hypothetical protein